MGQKVHPNGIRLGITKTWNSIWYSDKDYASFLHDDFKIRSFLNKKLKNASLSKIVIDRQAKKMRITIHTARPGVVIGKGGEDIDKLRQGISNLIGMKKDDSGNTSMIQLNIFEVRKPELDANIVAHSIASQLEKRVMFRRAMKRAVQNAMKLGAKGIKVRVSGRLGGAEIARPEWYREGRVPLHTLRADIDYSTAEADTTYGILGVKVWIFKGERYEALPLHSRSEEGHKKAKTRPTNKQPHQKRKVKAAN